MDISVIIPTFNRAELLRRALASVAKQTLLPGQVIIVDDGGTDNTADVAVDFERQVSPRGVQVIYHKQSNSGPAQARNTAIKMARGELLAFLDSDDLWRPEFLRTMHDLLAAYPSAALAFCGMDVIDLTDRIWTHRPTGLAEQPRQGLMHQPFAAIVRYMPMGTPCVMLRRSTAEEMGGFDVSYHLGEDWDLWYRISREYDFAYCLDPLTLCREHPRNMPKDNAAALADRVRLNLQHLPAATGEARATLMNRHLEETVLYQEQLLREGRGGDDELIQRIIAAGLAPKSLRFTAARVVRRGPGWIGRVYAGLVRHVGHIKRAAIAQSIPTSGPPQSPGACNCGCKGATGCQCDESGGQNESQCPCRQRRQMAHEGSDPREAAAGSHS